MLSILATKIIGRENSVQESSVQKNENESGLDREAVRTMNNLDSTDALNVVNRSGGNGKCAQFRIR